MFSQIQQPALQSRETNADEIVAQTMVQGRRMYTTFATKDKYAEYILSNAEGSDFCNEVLYGDVATFLDLDCKLQIPELGFETITEFISGFNEILVNVYDEYLGLELNKRSILWSESCREDKTSFHIKVANNAVSWKKSQVGSDLREFAKIIRDETLKNQG